MSTDRERPIVSPWLIGKWISGQKLSAKGYKRLERTEARTFREDVRLSDTYRMPLTVDKVSNDSFNIQVHRTVPRSYTKWHIDFDTPGRFMIVLSFPPSQSYSHLVKEAVQYLNDSYDSRKHLKSPHIYLDPTFLFSPMKGRFT